ncbi:nucleoside hydrolase [uncultured Pseudokineococcus sp.]|uniref:nucleoside hydrolase n=1 Tax=uncultured Pseudokineococcus sp. TaxID=1642928 RepID=UPI002638C7E5|nr:nucleoside hydrolase [uncultured Pseudokineococcus sp.]
MDDVDEPRPLPPLTAATAEDPVPVVLDCDPGVDDAVALLLALAAPELDVRAVTTVAGNASLDLITANAARVLDLAGARGDLPLARGAAGPLGRARRERDADVHGPGALGGLDLPPSRRAVAEASAVDVVARAAAERPGELVLVALGPLTTVAALLALHPESADHLREVVLMGGAAFCEGNSSPTTEFNLRCDPDAARRVTESGVPLRVVPLDATQRALVGPETTAPLLASRDARGRAVGQLLQHISTQRRDDDGLAAAAVHDALAVAAVLDPTLCTWVEGGVRVETSGELTRGELVVDTTAGTDGARTDWARTARVAVDADAGGLGRLLVDRLA